MPMHQATTRAIRKAALASAVPQTKHQLWLPIDKVDEERRMVWGYASTESLDSQNEVITKDAIKEALPAYLKFFNIREMHQNWAVGVGKEHALDDTGLRIGAKIVDNEAWEKVKEGVYRGFSIGGREIAREGNKITRMTLSEISLVDRPANPECLIETFKACGIDHDCRDDHCDCTHELRKAYAALSNIEKIIVQEKGKWHVYSEDRSKHLGGPYDTKAEAVERLRQVEGHKEKADLDEDEQGAKEQKDLDQPRSPAAPEEEAQNQGASGNDDPRAPAQPEDGEMDDEQKREVSDAERQRGEDKYGDVRYADPKNNKYPIDTEEHCRAAWSYINMPKNAGKYSSSELAAIKGRIKAAAKKHGIEIGEGADHEKVFKGVEQVLDLERGPRSLRKDMYSIGTLCTIFQQIKWIRDSQIVEELNEGDDAGAVSEAFGVLLAQLGKIIGSWVTEELGEETPEGGAAMSEKVETPEQLVKRFGKETAEQLNSCFKSMSDMGAHHDRIGKAAKAVSAAHEAVGKLYNGAMESFGKMGFSGSHKEEDEDHGSLIEQPSEAARAAAGPKADMPAFTKLAESISERIEKALDKRLGDLDERLKKIEAQPLPAKGPGLVVDKGADLRDGAAKIVELDPKDPDYSMQLIKRTHQTAAKVVFPNDTQLLRG